jgi:ubiquinone/menaquinone biosynthesis C-methylase UbiE
VLSNGVLNLAPDKHAVLSEVCRVLKPGGRLYLADVVVQRELIAEARGNPDLAFRESRASAMALSSSLARSIGCLV